MRAMVAAPVARGFVYPNIPEKQLHRPGNIPATAAAQHRAVGTVQRRDIPAVASRSTSSAPCPRLTRFRVFLADKNPHKRGAEKIDELLSHPRHASLLATRLCGLTELVGAPFDTAKSPGSRAAQMAHDWFRKRLSGQRLLRSNRPGGPVCDQPGRPQRPRLGRGKTRLRKMRNRLRHGLCRRATLDHYCAAHGSKPPMLEALADRTASAFLGVRLECAQCHDHPLDGWTPRIAGRLAVSSPR